MPPNNGDLNEDPEVVAERRKSLLWHIKLERWIEVAKAVKVFLQTFKSEAISLISGLGTLILGWYQVKKWIRQGHAESMSYKKTASSYELIQNRTVSKLLTPQTTETEMASTQAAVSNLAGLGPKSMAGDPLNYTVVIILGVFVFSTAKAALKKFKKKAEVLP